MLFEPGNRRPAWALVGEGAWALLVWLPLLL